MRRIGPIVAGLLVILVNLVVLLGIWMNRRGEPDATLTLTERELPVAWVGEENSGLALRLDWGADAYGYHEGPGWFDRDKLQALGFDCSRSLDGDGAELWYGKQLPLQRYAVLEFEGKSWAAWLAGRERELQKLRDKLARRQATEEEVRNDEKLLAQQRVERTRLFLVDVGRDPARLRAAYSDRTRFIIAPAVVALDYSHRWNPDTSTQGPPYLSGHVSQILVDTLHVSRRDRAPLDAVREEARRAAAKAGQTVTFWTWSQHDGPPRYEVTVKFGRRLEPWIAGLRRLPPS
jgi:Domain of unknown function (DUF4824)